MRTARVAALAALCALAVCAQSVQLGSKVPAFTVYDLNARPVTYASGAVTVVVFFSTTCPVSNAFNDRMAALDRDYSSKSVRWVFVDANSNESSQDIAKLAKEAGWTFAVHKDERNIVADRFGAMATPETFVIDASGVLRYHGYIDDSINEARVKNRGLRKAIDAVLEGRAVAVPETKAFGCTIKRVRRIS